MMNVEKRNGLWDSLKFVLIVLVVYGHLLEQSPSGTINRAIFNFIYIFHMPLFIFISGRFSHVKDRKKYVRGIYKLLETFIFFQIVWSFIDYMSLKDTSIMQFFIVPRWTLWYLLSLVFWRLMVLLLTDDFLMYHKKFIIFSSLIISIIGGFVPVGGVFSFQRTITFLPFFLIGYYSIECNLNRICDSIKSWMIWIYLITLFFVIYTCLNIPLGVILTGNKYYMGQNVFLPEFMLVYRLIFILFAIVTGLCVIKLNQSLFTRIRFDNWGKQTIYIYMFHTFAVKVVRYLKCSYDIPYSNLFMPLIAMIIVLGIIYLAKYNMFKFLLNPVSSIIKK